MTIDTTIRKAYQIPVFRSKRRPCGFCGCEFSTTRRRRYHCRVCRMKIVRDNLSEKDLS